MKRMIVSTMGILCITVGLVYPSLSVAGWMDNFYNQAGAAANITAPSAINSQNVTGFTGGGITWRIPSTTLNPVQITPPSLKAGCSGIDGYLGGFSFVNKAQFVNALRNFGQASVGYFFDLALRSMAPEVSVTLEYIADVANQVNRFGANTCQMAQLAVSTVVDKVKTALHKDATSYSSSTGEFSDYADATLGMQTGGGSKILDENYLQTFNKPQNALTVGDVCSHKAVQVNAVYWAICHSNINLTDDEVDLIMSIMGADYVVGATGDGNGDLVPEHMGHGYTIQFDQLVGSSGEGVATLNVITCNRATDPECVRLRVVPQQHSSFTKIAEDAISEIRHNIQTRTYTALSPATETVLKLASVPLWRVAALAETGSGLTAQASTELSKDLAQYAALEAAMHFVDHYFKQMDRALSDSGAAFPAALEGKKPELHQRIQDIRRQAVEFQQQVMARGRPYEKIAELERIERSMMSKLSEQLAANQRFLHRS